jgi:hypothetical protein
VINLIWIIPIGLGCSFTAAVLVNAALRGKSQ